MEGDSTEIEESKGFGLVKSKKMYSPAGVLCAGLE